MRLWLSLICTVVVLCGGRGGAYCNPARQLLKISGEAKQGNLTGSFNRTVEPSTGHFAESLDLGIVRTGSGFDGRFAWSRDVSGASHYLNSEFARRIAVSEAWLTSHLACPAPKSAGMTVDSITGFSLGRFTPPGGAPIELAYAPGGRLDQATLQYSENRLIHHYSDWRAAPGGQLLPFKQRDEDPEDESDTIYTIEHVSVVKSAAFAPPPPPNDSRIADGTSTTIPFQDDGGHRVYLPVYLNGKGPFAFELDNGGHFILTSATSRELGLTPQGSFASTGAGTEIRQAGYVRVGNLRIGNAEVLNQTAKVLPLSHNDRPGLPPRAGILGLELFERFIVTVDHRGKTVTLALSSRSPQSHPGKALRLLFDEDAPLVAGSFAGAKGNVMLDIGNAGSTIIEHYWAQQNGLVPRLARGTKVEDEWLSTGPVSLGPFTLQGMKVAYFGQPERGSESTHSVAAIAGEPLLSHFDAVYDYGRQTVWLDPLPNEKRR
ncbi:MAG TPA: retropepsin-like aspartic protease [Sphingomicrobium sp.]|nr:retropepsin-like aspartic protease [Sphingomicrobium sp.]